MAEPFSRSVAAQAAAMTVITTARTAGLLDGPVTVAPALADSEKALFYLMLQRVGERMKRNNHELSSDEISSMFTFVFAKAAEAVTNMMNGQPDQFDLLGLFDGKVPIYAEEHVTGYFKSLTFPADAALAYWNWFEANQSQLADVDPVLPLFEALKWTFRLSCHLALVKLEEIGRTR